jgi:hypothetical protein
VDEAFNRQRKEEFKKQDLRRRDVAQDLAELSAKNEHFVVPTYLREAIVWITEAQTVTAVSAARTRQRQSDSFLWRYLVVRSCPLAGSGSGSTRRTNRFFRISLPKSPVVLQVSELT